MATYEATNKSGLTIQFDKDGAAPTQEQTAKAFNAYYASQATTEQTAVPAEESQPLVRETPLRPAEDYTDPEQGYGFFRPTPESETEDTPDEFRYGYARGEGQRLTTLGLKKLEQHFPNYFPHTVATREMRDTGSFLNRLKSKPLDEKIANASPEEIRIMQNEKEDKRLREQYPDIYANNLQDSGTAMAGEVVSSLVDPTTLLPVGGSSKLAQAAIGGVTAGTYSAASQDQATGEIDPKQTAIATLAGSVLSPLVIKGFKKVGEKLATAKNKREVIANNMIGEDVKKYIQEVKASDDFAQGILKEDDLLPLAAAEFKEVLAQRLPKVAPEERLSQLGVETGNDAGWLPTIRQSPEEAQFAVLQRAQEKGNYVPPKDLNKPSTWVQLTHILSTRIRDIDEAMGFNLRAYDMRVSANTHAAQKEVEDFARLVTKATDDMPEEAVTRLNKHLFNGEFKQAAGMLGRYGDANSAMSKVESYLATKYTELKDAGYKDLGQIDNYFPRKVKDYDGLSLALGKNNAGESIIQKANTAKLLELNKLRKSEGKPEALELSNAEKNDVINKVVQSRMNSRGGSGKLTQTQKRAITEVPEELAKFYESPVDSLFRYIRSTEEKIAKGKFFGESATTKPDVDGSLQPNQLDIDLSVNKIVAKANKDNDLSNAELDNLTNLLMTRFVAGEKAMNKSLQFFRNVGYATTLANPLSAATQAADISVSAYVNGMSHTLAALVGKNKVEVEDIGLMRAVSEEMKNEREMADSLHWLFRKSGFHAIDKLGKNVMLNASLRRASKLVKTEKGIEKLRRKYGKAMGEEFDGFVNSLKKGDIDENVKIFLWSELADVQPIALSEMPESYLNSPNGRLFYMMKSFTLKQFDIIRRDIKQEYQKGNKKEAFRNAAAYMLFVPTANTLVSETKDRAQGRGGYINSPSDAFDQYMVNFFKTFGGSSYLKDQVTTGRVSAAAANFIIPPTGVIEGSIKSANQLIEGKAPTNVLRHFPLAGKVWDNFYNGGLERSVKRRKGTSSNSPYL
tara:strand:- start:102 stop:3167 length:3066 start_codon:yes stop_codon:yes gene_type:complete